MKNQFLIFLISIFATFYSFTAFGQHRYSTFDAAVGLRLTNGYGISGKFGMPYNDGHYLEIISYYAGYNEKSTVNVSLLYELSVPLVETVNFYYGLGPSINILTELEDTPIQFALSGIIGVDYTFKNAPFNISFDYLPNYSFNEPENYFYDNGFGLTARYIF